MNKKLSPIKKHSIEIGSHERIVEGNSSEEESKSVKSENNTKASKVMQQKVVKLKQNDSL